MESSNQCPYCGTSVSPAARYCDNCGTPLKQAPSPTPTRRRERSPGGISTWLFAAVLLVVFAAGSLGGFRYHSGAWPWASPAAGAIAGGDEQPESRTVTIPPSANANAQDPMLDRYLRSVVSINVRGEQGSKSGSGFLIDTGGHIVTSAHVVEGFRGCVNVIDDNGTTHLGAVVNRDRNLDVAMIYAPTLGKWPDVLSIRRAPLAKGDQVYALGSPKGTPTAALLAAQVEQTGLAKRIDDRYYANLVEFRGATVLHGSSGSPLLHRESGQVVGVVTAAADTSVAYAVPVDGDLATMLEQWAKTPAALECDSQVAATTVPLALATITPLSGANGVWGSDLSSGVELALRDMEADLRKVGYELSISRFDDQGDVEVAREHARTAAYDQEIIGVVGSFNSQVTAGIAETLQESGLVLVAPLAGADDLTSRGWLHFNRLVAPNARLEATAASYAKHRLKARSVLLVTDGSSGAAARTAAFETSAQLFALPVAGRFVATSDFSGAELRERLRASGADVVYYAGGSQTGFRVVQELRQHGIMLPVIGGAELYTSAFQSMTGPAWRSTYFTHFTAGRDERFERHFEAILGKPPRGYGMFGYDAARVILEALVRYGEEHPAEVPSRAELAARVRATRGYPGWSTTVTFDQATGENQAARVYLFEWVSGNHELRE